MTRVREPGRHEPVGPARLVPERRRWPPPGPARGRGVPRPAPRLDRLAPGPQRQPPVQLGPLVVGHGDHARPRTVARPRRAAPSGPDAPGSTQLVGVGPAAPPARARIDRRPVGGPARTARTMPSSPRPAAQRRGPRRPPAAARTSCFGRGHECLSAAGGPAARPGISPRPTGRLVACTTRPISAAAPPGDRRFSAAVAAVTSAFGDPTRREIYLHVRSHPGATASEVATAFSLHPNVARHHLDRLAAGGYLEVSLERPPSAGAGRPSKRYRAADGPDGDPTLDFVTQRDDLLVTLLAEALELLGPERGRADGRARRRGVRPRRWPSGWSRARASARCAPPCTPSPTPSPPTGSPPTPRTAATSTAVVAEHCPFGEAATPAPRDLRRRPGHGPGAAGRACAATRAGEPIPVVLSSRARGDDACAALV